MNAIICAAVYAIFFGLIGFIVLLIVLMIDSIVHGHDFSTSKKAAGNIIKIISAHESARNFYDLGCARGTFAIRIKKNFPGLSVRAIDNNFIRILFAKIKALLSRCHIDFLSENIFNVDLSDADIVYTYLWYDVMPPLEKKLLKELKQGSIVITNTSKFPTWKPIKKIVTCPKKTGTPDFETLFVYQKN